MTKISATVMCLMALSTANTAYAISHDKPGYGPGDYASSALQEISSFVLVGLGKDMQASKCTSPTQRREKFGIDDLDNYTRISEVAPVLISVAG